MRDVVRRTVAIAVTGGVVLVCAWQFALLARAWPSLVWVRIVRRADGYIDVPASTVRAEAEAEAGIVPSPGLAVDRSECSFTTIPGGAPTLTTCRVVVVPQDEWGRSRGCIREWVITEFATYAPTGNRKMLGTEEWWECLRQ